MPDNPYQSPRRTAVVSSRHTWWCLAGFYTLAVIWGLRNSYFWKPSALDLLVLMAQAICLGWWAVVDAGLRGRPIPLTAHWWFFVFAPVVAPCYTIWSRGWRGILWVALHSFGWLILSALVMNFGGLILFGREWLNAAQ